MEKAKEQDSVVSKAQMYGDLIVPTMKRIRKIADELETVTPAELWPYPTYEDLLFRV
jgi:glutamine synthetase